MFSTATVADCTTATGEASARTKTGAAASRPSTPIPPDASRARRQGSNGCFISIPSQEKSGAHQPVVSARTASMAAIQRTAVATEADRGFAPQASPMQAGPALK
jgi:hypothetical protein